jgi:predicted P-loop ATPase
MLKENSATTIINENQNENQLVSQWESGNLPILKPIRNKKRESTKEFEDVPLFIKVETYLDSRYDFQYNEVLNEIECKLKDESEFGPLNENNLFRELQHNRIKIGLNNLVAILRSDFVETVNPFKNYFESLPVWNEQDPDYITILGNHVKAMDQAEFNNHLKKTLVRTVACALDDNYFNKHAFILVGKTQNTGKSTFIRFLCPPALKGYISENLATIDKDSIIALSDNFIINIDELAILGKSEINTLKAFLSRDRIKIRHPFDKRPKMTPRRASFFGSTNNSEFLTDETGSVRWLCFEIETISWEYNESVNIDLVYSQAYFLWKSDFKYQLTPEEIISNEKRNKPFQRTTIEQELIQKFYKTGTKDDHELMLTATDVMTNIAVDCPSRISINIISVGKAMTSLGFIQGSERLPGRDGPSKIYYIKQI